ncbi:hypothetical protein C4D60_Mb02t06070 [Musa balbisiana]|uniref:Protein kinase domain-containing protein n=1 Tax=Musa balbisiana TaxID=52838 RepID=A0A4S8I8L0_MUSBA|nr:hypothetical protein C4D60_Mb02t06070 [Musa balbisiana]
MNLRSESQPGGRKSRSSFVATPDRWENSRSSAASFASSAATGGRKSPVRKRNAFKAFLRALVSFFSSSSFKPEITSPRPRTTRTLESPYATPSRLSHTSSRESRKGTNHGRDSPWQRETGSTQFTMEEILKATKNFSPSLKIGQGGFGTVYKATLDDGTPIAVKRAKKSMYENHLSVEFQSEINILGQIEHLNLVRFFGYLEDNDEKVVVTEYVPNGTLREHIDGFRGNFLELSARLDIAVDVAHAVTYLHMYAGFKEIKGIGADALKNFRQGKTIQVLDPNIPHTPANNLALEKILELAFQCLAPSRQNRPSMRICAEILWNIRKDYRELSSSDLLSQT